MKSESDTNMFKKDSLYAFFIGIVTAFFISLVVTFSDDYIPVISDLPRWSFFVILPVGEFAAYSLASRLFSHVLVLKQLGRFAIVGLMNFFVDTGIVVMLRNIFGIPVEDARMIFLFVVGASIAITNSYFWQRLWTFQEKDPPSGREFFVFVGITVAGIAINVGVAFLMVQFLAPLELFGDDPLVVASKVLATLVSLFWNFFGYKFIVFGNGRNGASGSL